MRRREDDRHGYGLMQRDVVFLCCRTMYVVRVGAKGEAAAFYERGQGERGIKTYGIAI